MGPLGFLLRVGASGQTIYKNLPLGIVDRALADPALAGLLRGGITFGLSSPNTFDPFVSFHRIETEEMQTTGKSYIWMTTFQVELYADSDDDLEDIAEAWKDVFNYRKVTGANPIRFARGVCFRVDSKPGPRDGDHGEATSGQPLKRQIVEIVCWQNRAYSL